MPMPGLNVFYMEKTALNKITYIMYCLNDTFMGFIFLEAAAECGYFRRRFTIK
jgi:hypothetical protein